MGIRSVRRGIRKWRAKAPQGEGKRKDRSRFSATWTLDPVVKPFGTTLKKEVRIAFQRWEKMVGYVTLEGECEK